MTFTFHDRGQVSSRKETPEGFLSVVADFARPGVQTYYAAELPRDLLPLEFAAEPYKQIRILRPESEVFADASMRSFARKPVTNDHPPEFINRKNWRELQVGMTDSNVGKQNNKLRVGLTLQDESAIHAVQNGKDQVSAGYDADLVWESGVDPVHGVYDAKQKNIRGNHIAIVEVARGGPAIKINDSWPEATPPQTGDKQPMAGEKLQSRTIGGITVDFSDQGAQVIDAMVKDLDQVRGQVKELEAQLTDARKERDELRGKLDAEVKNRITDEQVEAKAIERMELVDRARQLHEKIDPTGQTPREIKIAAIQHVDSSFTFDDKSSDDYVNGVFETLHKRREDTSTATMRDAAAGANGQLEDSPAVTAQQAYIKRSAEAWKGGQA